MQIKTILNRIQKFKSFVYGAVRLIEMGNEPAIEAELRSRSNSQALCSGCDRPRPGYDTLAVRRFEFVPLWGMKVFFVYAPRRVDCPACGVRVERAALGRREASPDAHLRLVSGRVGQAPLLERSGTSLSHELGLGIPLGRNGGRLGSGASGSFGYPCHRGG